MGEPAERTKRAKTEGAARVYIPNPLLWNREVVETSTVRRRQRKLLETIVLLEGLRAGAVEQRKRAKARLWAELPTGFCASVSARHEAYIARDAECRHLDKLAQRARNVLGVIEKRWLP